MISLRSGKTSSSESTISLPNPGPVSRFLRRHFIWGHDCGLDKEQSEAAIKQVGAWREDDNLPFPGSTEENIEHLADTLNYPPLGSPEARLTKSDAHHAAEPLSAHADSKDIENEENAANPERRK